MLSVQSVPGTLLSREKLLTAIHKGTPPDSFTPHNYTNTKSWTLSLRREEQGVRPLLTNPFEGGLTIE